MNIDNVKINTSMMMMKECSTVGSSISGIAFLKWDQSCHQRQTSQCCHQTSSRIKQRILLIATCNARLHLVRGGIKNSFFSEKIQTSETHPPPFPPINLGNTSWKKRMFSFGHCPNYLSPPPPPPNSGNLYIFFGRQKGIYKVYFLIRARPSPPPHSGNARKKTFFFTWGVP